MNIFVDGMLGIGDNIFQRPFIKTLCLQGNQVWLKTATPEIYFDLPNLHFVKSNTALRTQKKNEEKSKIRYETLPNNIQNKKRIFYGIMELQRGSVFDAGRLQFGCQPSLLDLPTFSFPQNKIPSHAKIALIRPTTERKEWHNSARGPLNSYVDEISKLLASKGYICISVADLVPNVEWITGAEPFAHIKFHKGELSLTELFSLVQNSSVVVTGSGVISQTAFAYGTPTIFLGGGCGGCNHHSKITDPRVMDLSKHIFIYPDNYCMCQQMAHTCDKTISNLIPKVNRWLDAQHL